MPVIADTAYPRLPAEPTLAELEVFTPEPAELAFARQRTRQPGPRLALLVLLKTFQHLGRVVRLVDVPAGVIGHIAAIAGLADNTGELAGYGDTTYRVRLAALVRGYVGVNGYDREARGIAVRACIEAARTRDDLADIVNAGIEELLRQRRELPAFGALLKLARTARALVNRAYHRRIATAFPPGTRERLLALLVVPEGATRSGWDQAKADPPRPSPQRMREHLAHLAWLRGQAVPAEAFAGVPDRKLRQFAAEARSLGAADLGRVVESKRLALMAALLRGQSPRRWTTRPRCRALMTRMHNRAREALNDYRAQHAAGPTPWSRCCARLCWPAKTRRPSGKRAWPLSKACCCPTPTRSWPSARRTRRLRATTTCPCSPLLWRPARAFLRFLATPRRSRHRRTAPPRRRSPSCWRIARTDAPSRGPPWTWCTPAAPPPAGRSTCPGWARSGRRC